MVAVEATHTAAIVVSYVGSHVGNPNSAWTLQYFVYMYSL